MAKKTTDPLASPAGKIWLAGELAKAERALVAGPEGQGWRSNETLRPPAVERAAFLRALFASVN